jgi:hypothetical protein
MKKYRVLCLENCSWFIDREKGISSYRAEKGDVYTITEDFLYVVSSHARFLEEDSAQFYINGAYNTHFAVEPIR